MSAYVVYFIQLSGAVHVIFPILFLTILCTPKYMYVVYFDQLLGAARTQKLVETIFTAVFNTFFVHFQTFFLDFRPEITEKGEN